MVQLISKFTNKRVVLHDMTINIDINDILILRYNFINTMILSSILLKVKIKSPFRQNQFTNRIAIGIFRLISPIIACYSRLQRHFKRRKFIGRPRTSSPGVILCI